MTRRRRAAWAGAYPRPAWPLAGLVVLLFAAAVGLTWQQPPTRADAAVYLLLTVGAAVSMLAWRVLGARELRDGELDQDLTSAWLVASAVLLPLPWALLTALPLELALQQLRGATLLPRRLVNAAGLGLATGAGCLVHDAVLAAGRPGGAQPHPGLESTAVQALALPAAAAAVFLVNLLLVGAMQMLYGQPLRRLLDEVSLPVEVAAAAMGALMAAAFTVTPLLLVIAGLPPLALLQRSLQHQHLLQRARTDPRTGLLHVGGWQEQADRALRRCTTRDQPVSLLAVDADHFKQINDHHGHAVGDSMLIALARALQTGVRPGDVLGRIGGEEFAVLLPDCSLPDAAALAERLRAAVADAQQPDGPVPPSGLLPRPVTISVGVAQLSPGQDLSTLLRRADTALYAAKTAGRDQVVCANDPPPGPPSSQPDSPSARDACADLHPRTSPDLHRPVGRSSRS